MAIFPGLDASGNSNNWTENNINNTDSTATTYDIMTDVPTLTDEDTANYAVLNPIDNSSTPTVSDANLTTTAVTSTYEGSRGSIYASSGKFYAEFTMLAGSNDSRLIVGIGTDQANLNSQLGSDTYSYSVHYNASTTTIYKRTNSTNTAL